MQGGRGLPCSIGGNKHQLLDILQFPDTDQGCPTNQRCHSPPSYHCLAYPSHFPRRELPTADRSGRAHSSGLSGREVLSTYFPAPKKKGGWRAILDHRRLNRFICKSGFCVVSHQTIARKSRRLQLSICKPPLFTQRRFLRFTVDPQCFQYRVLLFRLNPASQVFMKVSSVIAAITGCYPCNPGTNLDLHVTQIPFLHGLRVNVEKSTLVPTQFLHFIEVLIDAVLAQAYWVRDRFQTLWELVI